MLKDRPELLVLVPISSQLLLSFMRSNLLSLSFFPTRHFGTPIKNFLYYIKNTQQCQEVFYFIFCRIMEKKIKIIDSGDNQT